MNVLFFVYGILATLIVLAICVGLSDYHELKDQVWNIREEIKKQYKVIRELRSEMMAERKKNENA